MAVRASVVLVAVLLVLMAAFGGMQYSKHRQPDLESTLERMRLMEKALRDAGRDPANIGVPTHPADAPSPAMEVSNPIPVKVSQLEQQKPKELPLAVASAPRSRRGPLLHPPPPPPAKKHDLPITEWKTTHRCYIRDDFSEICVYENVCFDGRDILFLDPERRDGLGPQPLQGSERTTVFEWVYWDPSPYPPPKSTYVPFMSMYADGGHQPSRINPKTLVENTNTIEVMEGSIYFAPSDRNTENLWHASMEAFGLWDAQMLNETLPEASKLPSMDYVLMRTRTMIFPGWARQTLRSMVQPHTQFLNYKWLKPKSLEYSSLDGGIYAIHEEYTNFPFTEAMLKNFQPPLRKNSDVTVSSENVLCTRNAVVLSQKPRFFSGSHSSQRYRERIFDSLGLPLPPPKGITAGAKEPVYSGKVLIDIRGYHKSRNWINNEDFAALVRYYGLTPTIVPSYGKYDPFEKQVLDVSEADVYVIVHGAGISNAIFMTPRATLIEIFPYGMRVPMYKYIASAMNVNYIELTSWLKGNLEYYGCGGGLHIAAYFERCQGSNMVNSLSDCVNLSKHACVIASLASLEEALISAYDLIGVNLNSRVDKLYSTLHKSKYNDYHDDENFLLIPNQYEKSQADWDAVDRTKRWDRK
jgi:hypothetical protein